MKIVELGRLMGVGAVDQFLSSVTNFAFVFLLAHSLSPQQLGEFGVAWSMVYLVESLCWSYLGEPLPPVAVALPPHRWRAMRSALLILSAGLCCAMLVGAVGMATFDMSVLGGHWSSLIAASTLAAIGLRAQQTLRRICYLDENRVLSLVSTIVSSAVLFGSYAAAMSWGWASGSLATICWGLSTLAGSLLLYKIRQDFAPCSIVFLRWLATRLGRAAVWLTPASLVYWAGNYSIVPLSAYLGGLELGGVMRLVQTIFAPLQQATTVAASVLTPRVARLLAGRPMGESGSLVIQLTTGLAAIAGVYGTIALLGSPMIIPVLFPNQAELITLPLLACFAGAATAEAARTGLSVVLISVGLARVIFLSRTIGLLCFGLALFPMMRVPDLATPVALVVGSISGLAVALALTWWQLAEEKAE